MKIVEIAKALIVDAAGNTLILRRSSTHPTLAGHVDLPGGLIEPDEEPGQAAAREIIEETGLALSAGVLKLTYAGTEAHGEESRVRLLYVARLNETMPAVTISWEHDKFDWVPIAELEHIEKEFHSFYHDALQYIRTHGLMTP
jgi:ADP-ribose pyrophosphatase